MPDHKSVKRKVSNIFKLQLFYLSKSHNGYAKNFIHGPYNFLSGPHLGTSLAAEIAEAVIYDPKT